MAGNIVDTITAKINCSRGKHEWRKIHTQGNSKYEAWECIHCGAIKCNLDDKEGKKK